MKTSGSAKRNYSPLFFLGIFVFILSRVLYLTRLPIFSDEAIYILWAQFSASDPGRYLFLPMLDGKPPLHTWLIALMLKTLPDPLLAARLLSVFAALGTVLIFTQLLKHFHLNRKAMIIGFLLFTFSPFLLFHQRMALVESLLTFFFTAGLYFAIKGLSAKQTWPFILFGISFGLTLWSKPSSLFFIPIFGLMPLLYQVVQNKATRFSVKSLVRIYSSKQTLWLVGGGMLAGLMLYSLRISPLFPSLFTRSADYTFTVSELLDGNWLTVLNTNIPLVVTWLVWYNTPFIFIPMIFERRKNIILSLMACTYILPLTIFGKVLYPRYFLPVTILFILMAVIGWAHTKADSTHRKVATSSLALAIIFGALFAAMSIHNPNNAPLVHVDKVNYLAEWSSGHGIPQIRDYILNRSQAASIVIATEGSFGTLPDGLIVYFNNSRHKNVEIVGIGQPVGKIPAEVENMTESKEVYLVVNSHRLTMSPSANMELIAEYPRPYGGPSLLFFRIHPTQ